MQKTPYLMYAHRRESRIPVQAMFQHKGKHKSLIMFGLGLFLVTACFLESEKAGSTSVESTTATPPLLQALPEDKEVVIVGKIGDDSSFTKRIGLISSDAIPYLIFRPGDLERDGGGSAISPQQVVRTTTGTFQLPKNTPQDFEIKITNVRVPGVYRGHLVFHPT